MSWLLTHETILRLSCFLGVFTSLLIAECLLPRRRQHQLSTNPRLPLISHRRLSNLGLSLLNTLLLRLLPGLVAIDAALWASQMQWGLFNYAIPEEVNHTGLFAGLVAGVSVLLLDMAIYWQHRLFHRVPWLWRLHRVHHCDTEFDTTTAIRFHPLEILLSMLYKCFWVIIIGAPAEAVIVFELILSGGALFNHSNLALPEKLDARLRILIVTPDMHRVHHSPIKDETNSNFGFSISCWDYLFKTYRAQPRHAHGTMTIGLNAYPQQRCAQLIYLLKLPFNARKVVSAESTDTK